MRVIEVYIFKQLTNTGEDMFIIFDVDFLKESLDIYVHQLPVKTVVLRQETREGLVAARLLGAKYANGEVLLMTLIGRILRSP